MKKYALAGCSARAIGMFAKPIEEKFSKYARLVGMFDPNHKRMEFYNHRLKTPVPTYTDFRKMLKQQKPDCLIVATIDREHHRYIIAANKSIKTGKSVRISSLLAKKKKI